MKRELRDRWVAALRSGEYEQGRRALKRRRAGREQLCCLGVLADIEGVPVLDEGVGDDEPIAFDFDAEDGPDEALLPEGFGGLSRRVQHDLAEQNDDEEASFAQIADWIEANVPVDDDAEVPA